MDWPTLLHPTAEASLAGLFLSSLLAATLLPGGSEAVLFAVMRAHPEQGIVAVSLATFGNTLGGMSTYVLARLLPQRELPRRFAVIERHGSAALLLAWAPVAGDALCAAAGWLRLNWLACALWMALGKGLRYLVVVRLAELA